MSAFLVDRTHIDLLIRFGTASRYAASWEHTNPAYTLPRDSTHIDMRETLYGGEDARDYSGRILWVENLKSLRYRYPDDTSGQRPGPIGLEDDQITGYTYFDPGYTLTPLEALHACDCLEYQSCEHPGWRTSEAKRIVEGLRHVACKLLEGDRGPWGWTAEDLQTRPLVAATLTS